MRQESVHVMRRIGWRNGKGGGRKLSLSIHATCIDKEIHECILSRYIDIDACIDIPSRCNVHRYIGI